MLFLIVTLSVAFVYLQSQLLFLLLALLECLMFGLGQLFLKFNLVLCLEGLQPIFLVLLCFLDILVGRFDDCQQFGLSVPHCLFFELLHPELLVLGALLSFETDEGLFPGFHLFCVVLLSPFVSGLVLLNLSSSLLNSADHFRLLLNQLLNLFQNVLFLQSVLFVYLLALKYVLLLKRLLFG